MLTSTRLVWSAIVSFVLLAIAANLGVVENWLHDVTGGGNTFEVVATTMAALFFGLALFIWIAALVHLRRDSALTGGRRALWYVIICASFVFGAMAYHVRFLRSSGRRP